jgi:hypothetical protein
MMTVTCGANASATGGVCDGKCAAGYGDCNNDKQSDGCEKSINTDPLNCGGCGVACSTTNITRACAGGSCEAGVCYPGWGNCGGTKLQNGCDCDLSKNACSGIKCLHLAGESCSVNAECFSGVCCGGTCRDTKTDAFNCGSCGTTCGGSNLGHTCTGGRCGCSVGSDCNSVTADGCTNNTCSCGGNAACLVGISTCFNGACKYYAGQTCSSNAQCLSNGCCNNVCRDTANDTVNCGGCGISCAANKNGHVCLNSACGCNSLSDCDVTTADNCGGGVCKCGAGAACTGGLQCSGGSCQ